MDLHWCLLLFVQTARILRLLCLIVDNKYKRQSCQSPRHIDCQIFLRYPILIHRIRHNFWQSIKYILYIGFKVTLNFQNYMVPLNMWLPWQRQNDGQTIDISIFFRKKNEYLLKVSAP